MIIIDASVAFKWYAEEESHFSQALHLLEAHLLKKQIISAPDFILYELGNSWATKTNLAERQIQKNLQNFHDVRIYLEACTFTRISKAIIFSKKYHVSVYDASYAVLAEEKNATLFTADALFVKQVHLPFVRHIGEYST